MRLFGWDLSLKRADPPRDPALAALWEGPNNSAGLSVTPENAMRSVAVYSCVRVISESIGMLPLRLFERLPDGSKQPADSHPLSRLVRRRPNSWQTPIEFRDQITMHAALRGVGYAQIRVLGSGDIELIPLNPENMRAEQLSDGRIVYEYRAGTQAMVLTQGEVLRVPYLVRNGIVPVSPVRAHAEAVASSILGREYTNTFLKNGGRPPGYVKLDVPFKDKEQRENFAAFLRRQFSGGNRGSTLVLEQGDYRPVGVSNGDAQLAEICNLSLLDICRIYRVPPSMVQEFGRATWANTEQMAISLTTHTLGPWIARWEQALSRGLLTDDEQDRYFFEFNVAGLLRGDIATRYRAYATGRQWGWLSINDVRDLESMNRIEAGGDEYLVPVNMTAADALPDPTDNAGGGTDGNGTTNPPA